MIDILFKGIDERQNQTHANGTIGGSWTFAHGEGKKGACSNCGGLLGIERGWQGCTCKGKEFRIIHTVPCLHKWFASFTLGWKVTIPAGCDSGNAVKIMGMVKERLAEVYGEG